MHENILVIEDDQNLMGNLKDLLEEAGYNVFLAKNGTQGISLAKEKHPDIILCDIMMPEKDGYKVKQELKSDSSTVGIPFIFLTAKSTLEDFRTGMQLGADDYIVKPYRAKDLLESIQVRLKRKEELSHTEIVTNEELQKKFNYTDRILVKAKNESKFVNIENILCISAESEYSQIELASGEKLTLRKLLKEWEDLLPKNDFIRIHRSTIININHISKIENWFNRSMKIYLLNSKREFIVSQRYTSKIKSGLGL